MHDAVQGIGRSGQSFICFDAIARKSRSMPAFRHLLWQMPDCQHLNGFEQEVYSEPGVHSSLADIDVWLVWRLVVLVGICLLLSMFNGPLSRT